MDRIAEIIEAVRKEKKVSLREIESATHIPKTSMNRYLRTDIKQMTLRDFETLCLYLDIDPAEVLGWARKASHSREADAIAQKLDAADPSILSQVDSFVDFLKAKAQGTPQP